ncbi:MAG: hypothetical protein WCS01_15750 [bacterium]
MIKRTQTAMPAACLMDIETRRVTHAGCPMCGGRKVVASVYHGKLAKRPCEWYGRGGRAELVVTDRGETWQARRFGHRGSR